MATYNYTSGLGNVAAYQVSGRPFASSSIVVPVESAAPIMISFPSVSRSVTIRNDGATTIRVGFSANGVSGSATNYFTLSQGTSYQEELKLVAVYLISDGASTGTATVIAGLTGIPTSALSGNWSGSAGVG